jgi:hypothetical protein
MALRDPVAVYNAADNAEVYLVQNALADGGIEAFVAEDNSQVGTWALGLIPELHKPQVWVERADIERAKPILDEFERRKAELQTVNGEVSGPAIVAICEECEGQASFPASQKGSVQQCPHCGGYVDVGVEESDDDWGDAEGEAEES